MKKTLLVLGLLSTGLFARPDDWSWIGKAQQARRGVVIPQSDFYHDDADIGIGLAYLTSLALDGLKTKYDCKIVDMSEGFLAFVCFEDDDVIVFCDIDIENSVIQCRGE